VNQDEANEAVQAVLARIAPEVDFETIRGAGDLQEELDLDSMDFLNLTVGLAEAAGIDIPERDGPELATLDGCVAYLVRRTN
jgi:acyl carrier protein